MGDPKPNHLGGLYDTSQMTVTDLDCEESIQKLERALHDGNNFAGISSMLRIMNINNRKDVINALTHLAVLFGMEEQLVNWGVEEAMEQCESRETVFREGDLYSVVLSEYIKYKGHTLAKELLSETVQKIAQEKEFFDIAQTAVVSDLDKAKRASTEETERINNNARKIRKATEAISKIVCESFERFVTTLGPVFAVLKEKAQIYHAGDNEVIYSSVIGLFFLRYICLGIAQALAWGILPSVNKSKTAKLSKSRKIVYEPYVFRNLNMVTKLLQKIASGETFKEIDDFAVFNERLPQMNKRMKKFIDDMINVKIEWPKSDTEKRIEEFIQIITDQEINWTTHPRKIRDMLASPPLLWSDPDMKKKLQDFVGQFSEDPIDWESESSQNLLDELVDSMSQKNRESIHLELRIVLDYISKSKATRLDKFNQQMVRVGKKLQARVPEGKMPYDYMTIWNTYSTINTLFTHKDALREYLAKSGTKRRRLKQKISIRRKESFKVYRFDPVKKEGYTGDKYYQYDIESTYHNLIKCKKYVVLVVYRGTWCTFCKENLKRWNEHHARVNAEGGIIVGLSSQYMDFCQETASKWKIEFPLIGDPENILARKLGIAISHEDLITGSGFYPFGMAQPSVLGFDQDKQQVYIWRTDPTKQNLDGATDRVPPDVAIDEIRRSLRKIERSDSEMSLDTSLESFDSLDTDEEESWNDVNSDTMSPKPAQECADPLTEVLTLANTNAEYCEHLIRELGKSANNRKLFHLVRKEHREKMAKKSSKSKSSKK